MSPAIIRSIVLVVAGVLGPAGAAGAQTVPPPPPTPPVPPVTAPAPPDAPAPRPVLSWDKDVGKSYLVPALDILVFDFVLNRLDYYATHAAVYRTSVSSIKRNATGKWVADSDPFDINQFFHPYQGSIYFGFARSAGLNYWESLGYTLGGSLLWEIAGETGPPSYNDQITTGFAGAFLGEPLFRAASLLLEGGHGAPGFWRELGAVIVSPSAGINRIAYGDRFRDVFPSRDPAVYARVRFGASLGDRVSLDHVTKTVNRKEFTADVHLAYGLPGQPGYRHTRPFDYFDFQFATANTSVFENIMSRGFLAGGTTRLATPGAGCGVSTAATTSSHRRSFASRARPSISAPPASGGSPGRCSCRGRCSAVSATGRPAPLPAAAPNATTITARPLRGLCRSGFCLAAWPTSTPPRAGTTSAGSLPPRARGRSGISRGDAAFTVRVFGRHSITLKYVESHRAASYPNLAPRRQTIGTFSLLYGFISDARFGAVDWHKKDGSVR